MLVSLCIFSVNSPSYLFAPPTPPPTHTPDNASQYQDNLEQISGQRTVPNVFINGKHIGGCDAVVRLYSTGELAKLLVKGTQEKDPFNKDHTYDYDLIVIGGGSGGLACSKVICSVRLVQAFAELYTCKTREFTNERIALLYTLGIIHSDVMCL